MAERTVSRSLGILIEGLSLAVDQLISIRSELKGLRKDLREFSEQDNPGSKEN